MYVVYHTISEHDDQVRALYIYIIYEYIYSHMINGTLGEQMELVTSLIIIIIIKEHPL